MRIRLGLLGLFCALPGVAAAQTDWRVEPSTPIDLSIALSEAVSFSPQRETLYRGNGFQDRFSVTTRDTGWSLTPQTEDPAVDLRYRRDWTAAHSYTRSGLEVSLTPHAGLGVTDGDPTAEAGATLRIGQGLNRLARDGVEAFGERPRWYLYAAGSKRAVGYNFARDRDGDFNRSGVSHDRGTYLGDASIGVAYRRGAMHTSFGVVYREIEAKGLRGFEGMRTDVSEGLVAFQLSIRPQ
jgi:hypothetical protein